MSGRGVVRTYMEITDIDVTRISGGKAVDTEVYLLDKLH